MHREGKWLNKSHTVGKWQNQALKAGILALWSLLLNTAHSAFLQTKQAH